ncbi:MAG TPA: proline dehydrogenase family protein [Streptosporangiaceae bacterium]|nr:proline dehydrogenase family protein [Streptosporangiaceae bacterium]
MLRRSLLAMSESARIRGFIAAAPYTKDVVARFVAGDTAADATRVTARLRGDGLLVTLDHLGEDTTEPRHAAAAADEYVRLIEGLARAGLAGPGGGAVIGAAEVSVKPSAVGLRLASHGEKTAACHIARICSAARAAGSTVTVDMEDHAAVEPTLRIVAELRAEFGDLGCVIQSYLRRSQRDCAQLAEPGIRVRLCKGAYQAPDDVAFVTRHQIDRSYARCLRVLMAGRGYPMLATHDARMIKIALAQATLNRRPASSYEFQMLYGVNPAEQRRLAAFGYTVRVYVPYGNDWYGYLMRRLAERPANLMFFFRALASRR